jgi:hypothetical protein
VTPDHLLALADQAEAEGIQLSAAGDTHGAMLKFAEAANHRKTAAALTVGNRPVIVDRVVSTETARRGNSVARASAQKSGHPVRLAISASKWKNLTAYAKHLGKSQAALSRYLSEDDHLETPPEVADQVRKDFGLGDDVWPRPPRR